MRALLALFAVWLAGCAAPTTAIVDGKVVPRLELAFTGRPYAIHHHGAHPAARGPSNGLRDSGGAVGGQVCGMQIDYDVDHQGDHVQLLGYIDNKIPTQLQVRDDAGVRHITGNLGPLGVELDLGTNALAGHVGLRVVAFEQQGDDLVGHMRLPDTYDEHGDPGVIRAILRGRDALWSMPAADQAAVLAGILTCHISTSDPGGPVGAPYEVGFGGPAGSAPPESSAVYRRGR